MSCNHDWQYVPDWGGNPDVPNGTFDASYFVCELCDEHQTEMPDDYIEPEPDFERY